MAQTAKEKFAIIKQNCQREFSTSTMQLDGIEFFHIGRNASHDFFVGMVDDFILLYSEGEGRYNEELEECDIDKHLSVYQNMDDFLKRAYYGHW